MAELAAKFPLVVTAPAADSKQTGAESMSRSRHVEDDKFERLMDAHVETMKVVTSLVATKNGNGKSLSEKASTWFPTILTMLVLGVSAVRFDTTRETKATTELSDLKAQVTSMIESANKLTSKFDTLERINLTQAGEINALKDLLKRGR